MELKELLHEFFNNKSDANKYLSAEQQEDLESDFSKWITSNIENNFELIARQILKYLNEKHHPHTTLHSDGRFVEISEGTKAFGSDEYIVD